MFIYSVIKVNGDAGIECSVLAFEDVEVIHLVIGIPGRCPPSYLVLWSEGESGEWFQS